MQRHAIDLISLVFGLIFAGFASVWALQATDVIDIGDVWVAAPIVLIAAGVIGLATALGKSRQGS